MKQGKLRGKHLKEIGFIDNRIISALMAIMSKHYKRETRAKQLEILNAFCKDPAAFINDEALGTVAQALSYIKPERKEIMAKVDHVPFKIYGEQQIEPGAIHQMYNAMKLPVAIAGALMPDAHQGFGLPIGGVLAANNAIIPYAVGLDIGCRMCLSVFELSPSIIDHDRHKLKTILADNTVFGGSAGFDKPMDDAIFSRSEFKEIKILKDLKDKAYRQIGSSGSGNHFVEFGIVEIMDSAGFEGLVPGKYLSLLSHSGSRGLGAGIANHYTHVARETCLLPSSLQNLAWLDMDSEAGQEYWAAMNLAGDYAEACHDQIHYRIAKALGMVPVLKVENHHNFAWKEKLANGAEAIVHRKGATPAGKGVLGIIPGSMTAPGYIVRGKGAADSLNSASHGAGRKMSRNKAKLAIDKKSLAETLKRHKVELLGGGLDEAPMAYKDIKQVMKHQEQLVETIGVFTPRIVKMCKG